MVLGLRSRWWEASPRAGQRRRGLVSEVTGSERREWGRRRSRRYRTSRRTRPKRIRLPIRCRSYAGCAGFPENGIGIGPTKRFMASEIDVVMSSGRRKSGVEVTVVSRYSRRCARSWGHGSVYLLRAGLPVSDAESIYLLRAGLTTLCVPMTLLRSQSKGPARRVRCSRAMTGLSRGATQLREAALRSFGLQDDERWGWYPLQRTMVTSVPATRRTPLWTAGVWTVDFLAVLREVNWTVNFLVTLREVTVDLTGLPRDAARGDGDETRTGHEKVGLAPTERDDDEEGLAPSTAGLTRQDGDYTPAARENGFSLILRSPRSFHETGRRPARPYNVYRPRDASLRSSKGLGNRAGR
ncbi:hypothetical protein EDB86DRAFT_3137838 [Lactarius hatsudake]|nr:hypothetical protein EDB86DRAFT_3137838 [Lactarius hatsudake]